MYSLSIIAMIKGDWIGCNVTITAAGGHEISTINKKQSGRRGRD